MHVLGSKWHNYMKTKRFWIDVIFGILQNLEKQQKKTKIDVASKLEKNVEIVYNDATLVLHFFVRNLRLKKGSKK